MKSILFMRHAEAMPAEGNMNDFDRPLTTKGMQMVQKQALLIKSLELDIQHIYTSNAKRTIETSNYLLNFLESDIPITEVPFLYHSFVTQSFLNFIHKLHSDQNSVMFIGHNPEISQLVQRFINSYTILFRPATLARVFFETNQWNQIEVSTGKLDLIYHA